MLSGLDGFVETTPVPLFGATTSSLAAGRGMASNGLSGTVRRPSVAPSAADVLTAALAAAASATMLASRETPAAVLDVSATAGGTVADGLDGASRLSSALASSMLFSTIGFTGAKVGLSTVIGRAGGAATFPGWAIPADGWDCGRTGKAVGAGKTLSPGSGDFVAA